LNDRPPVLVVGIGNPARGDDAIGPLLIERLAGRVRPSVELLTDYQLQVEFVLDLQGRDLVIFVDASVAAAAPFECRAVTPAASHSITTHALAPSALLAAYEAHFGLAPPRALALAVQGCEFELGAGLSAAAADHLEAALRHVQALLA
jgi:hydrogenase maturation protease